TYALVEIADPQGTAEGLKSANLRTRRAALIALDQMANGGLKAETVARELSASDARMKEAAWWIAGRHPDWGGTVAGFLRERLAPKQLATTEQDELARQLGKLARGGPVQELLTATIGEPGPSLQSKQIALRAMAQAGLKAPPDEWITALAAVLAGDDFDLVQE